jgi:hypothetical protein
VGELIVYHPPEAVAAAQKAVDAASEQLQRHSWRDPLDNTLTTIRGNGAFHHIANTGATERMHIETIRLDEYGRPLLIERLDLPQNVTDNTIHHLLVARDPDLVTRLTTLAADLAEGKPLRPETYQRASVIVFSRPHPKTRYGDPIRALGSKIRETARGVKRKVTLAV